MKDREIADLRAKLAASEQGNFALAQEEQHPREELRCTDAQLAKEKAEADQHVKEEAERRKKEADNTSKPKLRGQVMKKLFVLLLLGAASVTSSFVFALRTL